MHPGYFIILVLILSVLPVTSAPAENSAVVLMYHRFGEDRYPSTSIQIAQFEAQLELLKKKIQEQYF